MVKKDNKVMVEKKPATNPKKSKNRNKRLTCFCGKEFRTDKVSDKGSSGLCPKHFKLKLKNEKIASSEENIYPQS